MEGGGSELSRKSMQLFLVFIRKVGQYFEGFSIEIMLTGLRACCNVYLYFLKFSQLSFYRCLHRFTFQRRNLFVSLKAYVFFYTYHVLIHLTDGLTPAQGNFPNSLVEKRDCGSILPKQKSLKQDFWPVRFCEKFSETVSKREIFRHPQIRR